MDQASVAGAACATRLQTPHATDANGTTIAVILTGANRNDITQLLTLVEASPPIRGVRGRPLRKPGRIYANRAYDYDKYRRPLHAAGTRLRFPDVVSLTVAASAKCAGWSNALTHGCVVFAVCVPGLQRTYFQSKRQTTFGPN